MRFLTWRSRRAAAYPNAITGKIVATPQRLSPAQDARVVISWRTNDPSGGEVRVSTSGGDEKLVSRGQSGEVEIPWIAKDANYEFRLFANSQPQKMLDSVKIGSPSDSVLNNLRQLAEKLTQGTIDLTGLKEFVAKAVPYCLRHAEFIKLFPFWERHGFHVTPVHFYQPIPDTRTLTDNLWSRPSELVGVDMNDSVQLALLRNDFLKFRSEYNAFPNEPLNESVRFHFNNGMFDGTDALVAYCMIRHFQPRLIIEIGSGFSSLLTREAVDHGNKTALICVEPFPREFLRRGFPGLQTLIEKNVQDVDLDFFSQLETGDFLFIDSSHTVKIGGDVNYLFLEVLPRLKPGVFVHVHDIMLPFDYRRDWVMDEFRFWTEQYLLQAFLTFNREFEVLMANSYLAHHYMDDLKAAFPNSPWWGGGSFWMRRRGP